MIDSLRFILSDRERVVLSLVLFLLFVDMKYLIDSILRFSLFVILLCFGFLFIDDCLEFLDLFKFFLIFLVEWLSFFFFEDFFEFFIFFILELMFFIILFDLLEFLLELLFFIFEISCEVILLLGRDFLFDIEEISFVFLDFEGLFCLGLLFWRFEKYI